MTSIDRSRPIFLIAVTLAAFLWADPAPTVISVHDGDTLRCSDQRVIRLLGIDACELQQPGPWGKAARDWLAARVLWHPVRVEAEPKPDLYGRTLAEVYDSQGKDLNLALVRAGLAFAYTPAGKRHPVHWREIVAAESEARAQRKGVWSDPTVIKPWDWRRLRRAPIVRPSPQATFRPRPRPPTPPVPPPPTGEIQAALLTAVNAERARYGRAPLSVHPALATAAARQAADCAARGVLTHVGSDGSWPWDRASRAGYPSRNTSEDAAAGQTSAQQAVVDWMNDPPHRQVLLGDWRDFGGAAVYGKGWGWYWFADFGKP